MTSDDIKMDSSKSNTSGPNNDFPMPGMDIQSHGCSLDLLEKAIRVDPDLRPPDLRESWRPQAGFTRTARRNLPFASVGLCLIWVLYSPLQLEEPSPLFAPLLHIYNTQLSPSKALLAYLCSSCLFIFPVSNIFQNLEAEGPRAFLGLTMVVSLVGGVMLGTTALEALLLVLPTTLIGVIAILVSASQHAHV